MRHLTLTFCGIGVLALAGCGDGTPGGPGANSKTSKPVVGLAEGTFNLDVPALSTKMKQGETKSVTIGIVRGTNFGDDVKLSFAELPTGVSLDAANPTIKHGEKEVKVNVTATETAALGDFSIKVTGHPSQGADAKANLKLTVDKK